MIQASELPLSEVLDSSLFAEGRKKVSGTVFMNIADSVPDTLFCLPSGPTARRDSYRGKLIDSSLAGFWYSSSDFFEMIGV